MPSLPLYTNNQRDPFHVGAPGPKRSVEHILQVAQKIGSSAIRGLPSALTSPIATLSPGSSFLPSPALQQEHKVPSTHMQLFHGPGRRLRSPL